MVQAQLPLMTHRRLLLFKLLMVFIPPATVAVGHVLLEYRAGLLGPTVGRHAEDPLVTLLVLLLVTSLALLLAYIFAETLFRVLRRLQAEALAREQAILTMNAVMQERGRLSRELHDGVAQFVADLLLRLDTIRELVQADRPQEAKAELERLHGVADEIYKDIGESITGLRTNPFDGVYPEQSERAQGRLTGTGLVRTLQEYVDQFEERHQIPVTLQILTGQAPDTAGQPCSELARPEPVEWVESISPLAALQVFRIIQEALTNVRKHAVARKATVTLMSDRPGHLKVVITDDGQGFTPGSQGNGPDTSPRHVGVGLTSMRERVEALGGTFQVNSRPGSGTQVTATIPMPRTRRESGHAALATATG